MIDFRALGGYYKSMKYRINRADERNWTLDRWDEGGYTIDRGPKAGETKKPGWKVLGYYPNIKSAAVAALDKSVGDNLTGADIIAAIEAAEARVLEAVSSIEATSPAAPRIQGTAADTLSKEQAETIRNATDPVKAYLAATGGKRLKRTSDETRRGLEPRAAVLERVGAILA